jgi:CubicO group peptidase (beta-lactamase class C family)
MPTLPDALDAAVRPFFAADGPGGAVLVVDDGRVAYRGAFGLADLSARTPVTAQTAFDLASVSKQFTAVGALILARRGLLSFDDDLRRHLPDWPCHDERRPIRLRDLLHHTSGVPDYSSVWRGPRRDARLGNADYLHKLRRFPLDFPTGSREGYSNSNYILLAEVLSRATGIRFRAFVEETIFRPLGMQNSWVHDEHGLPIRKRARGYQAGWLGRWKKSDLPIVLVGHSHLFTTLEDMALWVQSLHGHRLVTPDELALAWTPGALDSGEPHANGFGWYLEERAGRRAVVHGGSWYGFANYTCHFAAERVAVVVLSNNESLDAAAVVDAVAGAYFRQR